MSQNQANVRRTTAVLLVAVVSAMAQPARAQVVPARLIPFQARLADTLDEPVADNVYKIVFKIYEQPTGGEACWTEPHDSVSVIGGQVNVLLGSLTPIDDPNKDGNTNDGLNFEPQFKTCGGAGQPACKPCQVNGNRYLGITVGASAQEMVPRHQLVPSFHARTAGVANAVIDAGIKANMIADNAVTTTKIPDGALTGAKIADGSLTSADLGTNSVTGDEIAPDAVGSSKIADGSVTNADIGINAVNSTHIKDGTVTAEDLSADLEFGNITQQVATLTTGAKAIHDALNLVLQVEIETSTICYLKDYKPQGTPAQTLIAGANSNDRILNRIEPVDDANCAAMVTIGAGGHFTLKEGAYRIVAMSSALRNDKNALRLVSWDTGVPTTLIDYQNNAWSDSVDADGVTNPSLYGSFSLAVPKELSLQQRVTRSTVGGNINGFGGGIEEMYSVVVITRIERVKIGKLIGLPEGVP